MFGLLPSTQHYGVLTSSPEDVSNHWGSVNCTLFSTRQGRNLAPVLTWCTEDPAKLSTALALVLIDLSKRLSQVWGIGLNSTPRRCHRK